MGSAVRAPGKEHMPNYPKGWITIRILQLIVAVVILGLCSYLVTTSVIGAGFYVQIFTAVCTIITSIWLICAHSCAPRAFNYWAVLVLDIYQYLLWLGGFAACAILAAGLFGGNSLRGSTGGYDFNRYTYSWYGDDGYTTTNAAIGAAAAGLGAVEFLFFFICLIVDSVVIHRHRRAGLHSRPVRHVGGSVMMMPPQSTTTYQAVPQTGAGVPFAQQETAYNPQAMYGAPPPQQQQQQGFYGQGYAHPQQPQTSYYAPAPLMPQHTGTSYHKTVSPVPAQQAVAYPPPQQQQPPHNLHYTG
ncbi:membrane-associatingdomain-containing protein [Cordyceps javanica]|uniref:Membrane-associatingdomain-containing protein n=1 Tax=Cordyceps javanica TaxID=43265 RepID=A0A545W705_9HYPO|nr:membrane-associatingdomain-containing protein [Cordyceps javanica]TQW09771.1 membrane-associating domain-containing protein [Cordyceps javanica]